MVKMRKTALKKSELRIVFMGTPEFAVGTLKALLTNKYNVVGVVTQPDKPVGRHGSILQPSAVKQYAQKKGIPVLQPEKMKDPEFLYQLKKWRANLQVVVAFRMLPEVVWDMPEYGTFNVHAALLPQYRGAAPINWAIINGETRTGVTTFFLDHEIETGRIILQKPFDIPDTADVEYVYDGLMHLGADICIETLERIVAADGHPESIPQDQLMTAGQELHPAPKIFKETCEIDWNRLSAKQVYDFVRGLCPVPVAWTTLRDERGRDAVVKIYKVLLSGRTLDVKPGTIIVEKKKLYIAANGGELVEIIELQLAGKKKMLAADFLNGNRNITASHCVAADTISV